MKNIQFILFALMLILAGILGACGSSSSGPNTTTVSGVVMAGPANSASVTVKTTAGVAVAGPVTTGTDGSFSVAIPNAALAGALVFEATGGTFPDEATATSGVTMGTLTSHAPAGSLVAGSSLAIDPASTIIQKLIAGGKTKTAAEADFATAFGYTPDNTVKPVFAGLSSVATSSQRLAGVRAAAFSQLAKDLGIAAADQFALINAIAADLADGTLDGGGTAAGAPLPLDLANRFGQALLAFQQSANNKSKVKADQIGAPVFHKTAYTTNYKVEYVPGSMAATTGKTMFKIKVSNLDGSAATGKTITLRPYMYMATKSHTTPLETVVESSTAGTYDCIVYYVMSTAMSGMSMGVWELTVTIDGTESARFYPVVGMPMGTTKLAKLTGISDAIMGMAGLEKRTWFLFYDGLTAGMGGTYTFKLFLATKEMGTMLTFPAVKTGDTLNDQTGTPWTVSTILVEVSTDNATWVTATETGNGHWSAAGLTGLTAGTAGALYVRLTVNGEQKTTDGNALGATNGYQTFTVTPAAM
jgi:hypothetical protein